MGLKHPAVRLNSPIPASSALIQPGAPPVAIAVAATLRHQVALG